MAKKKRWMPKLNSVDLFFIGFTLGVFFTFWIIKIFQIKIGG